MFVLFINSSNETIRLLFFFSSRRRHTRSLRDWSSDVCSSDLAVEHIAGRPEGIGRNGVAHIGFVSLLRGIGLGGGEKLRRGKMSRTPEVDQGALFPEILFALPYGGKASAQEAIGVMAAGDGGDHESIRKVPVERPKFRMQMEGQAALLPPALQLEDAVSLPRGVTLGQRQSTGIGEDLGERHRLVIDRDAMAARDVHERRMTDVGPW